MKLKDIEVGQSYLRRRGRGYTDQIVYVVVRGGSGVAIAVGAAYAKRPSGEAVGRLTTLGVPAFKTGYGLGSTLSIRYEDIAKLEALIGEAS